VESSGEFLRPDSYPSGRAMRRDLSQLANRSFDLLVVGGGIQGACIARDATLRGLSVAILDRGDFGAATSANSLRIVHGGLRYLVRGDLPRMQESIRERSAFLRIAPHLVEPLPVLVPIYSGSPMRGRIAHQLALATNDLVSWRRNRGLQHSHRLPRSRLVSRGECLQLFPWLEMGGLTGGAIWYDARVRRPERLTLEIVCSAFRHGAAAANYVRVDRLVVRQGVIEAAAVTDMLGGATFDVRAKSVVVAAGPWTESLIACTLGKAQGEGEPTGALALNVVIGRELAQTAVGVQARSSRPNDPAGSGKRFLFFHPQRAATLLGTWYSVGGTERVASRCEAGARQLVQDFNAACPALGLSPDDVVRYQAGWLPLETSRPARAPAQLADRPIVANHGTLNGVRHLFSVEAVKFTTARRVAEGVVDQVFRDLRRASPPCRTAELPVDELALSGVLDPELAPAPACITPAIRDEMAVKLSDIVYRRLDAGVAPVVTRPAVEAIARTAGPELGWDQRRQESEIEEVLQSSVPPALMEPVG
jgi:glycerol-3-phosphate dehydrogenase